MSKNKLSFLNSKKALIINFTGDTEHWGCYGTSLEIYQTLIQNDYYIETISVKTIHNLSPTIDSGKDLLNKKFFEIFYKKNKSICNSLSSSDDIYINGEGTLHGLKKGPLNLLYLIFIAKKIFNKNTFLINFSIFPNDNLSSNLRSDSIYTYILKQVDRICVRETISQNILKKNNINSVLGFDCLPRFLFRHNLTNIHNPSGYVLIAGGVVLNEERIIFYKKFINYLISQNIPIRFLLGAKSFKSKEDEKLKNILFDNFSTSDFIIVEAANLKEWINAFKNASFFFSARFHHTIAALCVGTPFNYLESNVPKIGAMLETLKENNAEIKTTEDGLNFLNQSCINSIKNNVTIKSQNRINTMINLAKNNFHKIN